MVGANPFAPLCNVSVRCAPPLPYTASDDISIAAIGNGCPVLPLINACKCPSALQVRRYAGQPPPGHDGRRILCRAGHRVPPAARFPSWFGRHCHTSLRRAAHDLAAAVLARYRFRFAPDALGTWQWQAVCPGGGNTPTNGTESRALRWILLSFTGEATSTASRRRPTYHRETLRQSGCETDSLAHE